MFGRQQFWTWGLLSCAAIHNVFAAGLHVARFTIDGDTERSRGQKKHEVGDKKSIECRSLVAVPNLGSENESNVSQLVYLM
ncbi:hypothetical protein EV356DRAFT_387107 [Viridothelium virens]|uniref:Secreted protein n=1 Tax=Viridothelium virens TaxID=1048519 RepID=A0A6A6GUX4_VIRVR|nr:hypothetical protein EV356DRAFT_387107 [Viridothelium virens]